MDADLTTEETEVPVAVRDIGGIDQQSVSLRHGVNVLSGENATNRTSFLKAIGAGLGADVGQARTGADKGTVELEIGGETYNRTLTGQDGRTTYSGSPYAEGRAAESFELFGVLTADNRARRAISEGRNLRDVAMELVDTEEIRSKIRKYREERKKLEGQLEEIKEKKKELKRLEPKIQNKREEIEEKEAEIERLEDEIESYQKEVADAREVQDRREVLLKKKNNLEDDLESAQKKRDRAKEQLASLRNEERPDVQSQLDEIPDRDELRQEEETLADEIQELEDRRERLKNEKAQIRELVGYNEKMLDGDSPVPIVTEGEHGAEDVTQALVENEDDIECWTCGSTTSRETIEDHIDVLRNRREQLAKEQREVASRQEDLADKKSEISEKLRRYKRLESELNEIERDIERREDDIERHEATISDIETELEEVTEELDNLDEIETPEELLELHTELSEAEHHKGNFESTLSGWVSQRDTMQEEVGQEDSVKEQIDEFSEQIEQEKERVRTLEVDVQEQFNERMDEIVEMLKFENIDRVWINRKVGDSSTGLETNATFELNIVRSDEDGTYEDRYETLSESEREVIGLIFALTGYLVHDVAEDVPFILLDSLEAIDASRISRLIDYIEEETEFLVAALLEEDAAALSGDIEKTTFSP